MDDILGALAFALLIGGQFLAVIVVASKRDTIFANPNERVDPPWRAGDYPGATQVQHCIRRSIPVRPRAALRRTG